MLGTGTVIATLAVLVFTYMSVRFLRFYFNVRRRARHILKFPGVDPHPIWGHIQDLPEPNEELLGIMREDNEEFSRMQFIFMTFLYPSVVVYHSTTVKEILRSSEPKPLGVGAYRFIYPWLGDGLLLAGGEKWARNRRLLTPAFHFDILKPYMEVNNQASEIMLAKMDEHAKKGESFEAFNSVSMLTLDIIMRCAFSYESDCQTMGETHPYVKAVMTMAETMVHRLLRPWLYPDFIFYLTPRGLQFKRDCDYVHNLSKDIVEKRRKMLDDGSASKRSGAYLDFLDILLTARDEDKKGLTDREIRDEVDTFMFEGHDTTASGISWALYDMATNPEWQTKVQQEVDEVLAGRDSDQILWEDLPKLKTLTMCIKESMRLHTPVPFIERQTTKDMDIDGYFLPSGTVVDIQLYVLHHNAHVWEDPMKYDPMRFTAENMQKMDSFAFVPFSAGPRNCIGQNFAMHEMKTTMARILRRFRLELDPTRPVEHRIMVVMKTEKGIYMKATPRNGVKA